jgi:hypothetical protein
MRAALPRAGINREVAASTFGEFLIFSALAVRFASKYLLGRKKIKTSLKSVSDWHSVTGTLLLITV